MQFPFTRLVADVLSWDTEAGEGKWHCREPGWRVLGAAATPSLSTINTLAGSSPELPAKPFLSQEPMCEEWAERSSTNRHLSKSGRKVWEECRKEGEERKEGTWEEFVAWNMEWFETETASWILNCGRCMAEWQKLENAVRATLSYRLMSSCILGLTERWLFSTDFFFFFNARFYKIKDCMHQFN